MLIKVLIATALCGLTASVEGSVDHDHGAFALGPASPPVVTSASSQYFERTFNRLLATPVVPAPAVPVLPQPSVIQAHAVLPAPAHPFHTVFHQQPPVIQTNTVLQPQPPVIQAHAVLPAPAQFPVNPVLHHQPLPQPSVVQTHPVFQPQARPQIPVQSVFQPRPFLQTNSVLNPQPQFFFQHVPTIPVPVNQSVNAIPPIPNQPTDPNINIAIATAHAAAPVATILLPPFPFGTPPFGFPPFGFAPPAPQINPEEPREETTTQEPTRASQTTDTEPEQTTPLPAPSNTDNSFAQFPPPSPNNNVNFKYGPPDVPNLQYGLPPETPRPIKPFPLQPTQKQQSKPLKLTTSVEIVPVPLAYMAPPPLTHAHYHHHHLTHHHHNPHHHHAKIVKYYVRTVPAPIRAKIIIRPVSPSSTSPHKAKSYKYRVPVSWERNDVISGDEQLDSAKEREPTTPGSLDISNTKPPKL